MSSPVSVAVRAIRGATTFERDEAAHVTERVQELVSVIFERNQLSSDDVISMLFTATSDLSSIYPASAARALGLGHVALMGAQELDVVNMLAQCIRVLLHVQTAKPKAEIRHVFLHGAKVLRTDLAD